jgi:hypothetical protein
MDKERYVAICVEEGLTEKEAETIWGEGSAYGVEVAGLTEEEVREAARHTAPLARQVRSYLQEEAE